MKSKSCDRCLGWTASAESVEAALRGKWRAPGCAHQSLMGTAIDQYKTGRPLWWVVNGAVVVPVWAVELVKRRGHGLLIGQDEELVA